jgi:tetratricopeptide (TPR) repeat protein
MKGVADTFLERAMTLRDNQSFQNLISATSIYDSLGQPISKAKALLNLGMLYRDKSDYENALTAYGQSLSIFQDHKLQEIGVIHIQRHELDQANDLINQALTIFQKRNDKDQIAFCFGNLGIIKTTQGNAKIFHLRLDQDLWTDEFQAAIEYHQKALDLFRETSYLLGEANEMANVGGLLRFKKQWAQGLKLLEGALQLHKRVGFSYGIAKDLKLTGSLYYMKGDTELSIKSLLEAKAVFQSIGNINEVNEIDGLLRDMRHK